MVRAMLSRRVTYKKTGQLDMLGSQEAVDRLTRANGVRSYTRVLRRMMIVFSELP